MPGKRDTSPVHVHVDDYTPVHVHIAKPVRAPSAQAVSERPSRPYLNTSGNRRPVNTSKVSTSSHWVPPPARTSKGNKSFFDPWTNTYHTCPTTRVGHEIEHDVNDVQEFEGKVESLINEVGKLKSEAELARTKKALAASHEDLHDAYTDNANLRHSVDVLSAESADATELGRALLGTELEFAALNRHLLNFAQQLGMSNYPKKDPLQRSSDDIAGRLADTAVGLSKLRNLLKHRGDVEREVRLLSDEKSAVIRRLAESEDAREGLEKELGAVKTDLGQLRDHQTSSVGHHAALESARAHLQRELRRRDADLSRQAVQMRSLEAEAAEARAEREHCLELLRDTKAEKEELKRAARALKLRVARFEEETVANQGQVDALRAELGRTEPRPAPPDPATEKEKESMRNTIANLEHRVNSSQSEIDGLRSTLKHYENLIEDYKSQVKSRVSQRMDDLSDLPELLKNKELELADVKERLARVQERPPSGPISNREVDSLNSKLDLAQQEARLLREQLEESRARLRKAEEELHDERRQKDSALGQAQILRREAGSKDTGFVEASSARERALAARVAELDAAVAQTRAELARARREKEEETRRHSLRISDMQERLEQSHSQNRSLQNYVQFLKTSYSSMFTGAPPMPSSIAS